MADPTTQVIVPSGRITLLDIAKANGSDGIVGLVDETIRATPEVMLGAARTIKGINYKTLIRKSLPTVGFRDANSGGTVNKSVYENKLVECYMLNPRIEADKMVADSYEDGPEAYLSMEATAVMSASLQLLGKCFYYGTNTTFGGDAKAFPGLLSAVDSTLVVDAGGTTDNTASSVWFVIFGQQNVQWVFGQDGQLALTPTRVESLIGTDGTRFTGYLQELMARPGLQVQNKFSLVRIKKITADAGHTLTDNLLGSALALLPAYYQNLMRLQGAIFMSPRSREQLRQSRTAINPTGAPAPTPTQFEGIPVEATDSISNTETLAL